jgi:toxin ParE1/3/4
LKRLVIARPAERDLDAIVDYIALDNPSAAQSVYRAIVAAAENLTRFPEVGRIGRLANTRELPVPSLPYLIVYEIGADSVTIVAIFHAARDLSRALEERKAERKR